MFQPRLERRDQQQSAFSKLREQWERSVMNKITTQRLTPDSAGIAQAIAHWRAGALTAFPTETVYGLGADARNDDAVAQIYAAKGRPSFNPLIVHVADLDQAKAFCAFDAQAVQLAARFWPGPLTLVLPLKPASGISKLVTAGLPSLAVRVPAHPLARTLLAAFGGPIAAPSANPSGRVSPTTADHVMAGLDGKIAAVMDGGPCDVGVESTIVRCIGQPALLRAGGVSSESIAQVIGQELQCPTDPAVPQAPGQLASHYAPKGRVRLNVTEPMPDEYLLGFGPVEAAVHLSPSGDVVEAAARLFAALHELDALDATKIAVSPIPDAGVGRAINDRLRRAAAPRK